MNIKQAFPLDQRVDEQERLGLEWANLYQAWLQLDETKNSVLADLQKDMDDGKMSEAKLKRSAQAHRVYREHIENLCVVKGQELRAKVRYDAAQARFEAGRSAEATEREKIKHLSHIP